MTEIEDHRQALARGTLLSGYVVSRVLGAGGFGITYRGVDERYSRGEPERDVAIKEYLPFEIAIRLSDGVGVDVISTSDRPDYLFGLEKFEAEARTLARFDHKNIVSVRRFIKANNTAYIVMPYERGIDLSTIIHSEQELFEEDIEEMLPPLLDGLAQIHAGGFLHRDIKPSNIYIRQADYSPLLLDFGAARQALGNRSRKLTTLLTPGYAPFEQYITDGNQGPWTDIYALAAVMYAVCLKDRPVEANVRIGAAANGRKDPYQPAAKRAKGRYSRRLLTAIDTALNLREQDRPQTIAEFRELLGM